jgi:hypothetical protein
VRLLHEGRHQTDAPPAEGGRWPISVVCSPDVRVGALLDELTSEAARVAGPHHWRTAAGGRAHFTVRALEGHRSVVPDDDPAAARYLCAMERTAARCSNVALRLTGLVLTPGTVMACAEPVDDHAFAVMDVLEDELGEDAWFELPFGRRDIWYVNLLHFTGPVTDVPGLVRWVDERRRLDLGQTVLDRLGLVRFELSGDDVPGMRPVTLHDRQLTGSRTRSLGW